MDLLTKAQQTYLSMHRVPRGKVGFSNGGALPAALNYKDLLCLYTTERVGVQSLGAGEGLEI